MDFKGRKARARLALGATLCTMALGGFATASATAATWQVTEVPDPGQVEAIFYGASCPTEAMCVVVGTNSTIATSTSPTGGAAAWSVAHVEPVFVPAFGGGSTIYPGNALRGVSCPSTGLCVVLGPQGHLFISTNPTGGAASWALTDLGRDASHMYGISCPSVSLCVAVDYKGRLITSTNPTGGQSAWKIDQLGAFALRGVSCASASLCAAVGNEGNILVSTNPTGGASAWSLVGAPGGGESINGISCPLPTLCVTGDADQIITSTDPGNPASWTAAQAGTGLPVKGFSCLTTGTCNAVDNNADVLTSTNPAGGAAAWSFVNVIPAPPSPEGEPNGMFGISCPSTALCVAAGTRRKILTSTDPYVPEPVKSKGNRNRPHVRITWHPPKRISGRKGGARASFRFRGTGEIARFKCKLNQRRYKPCKSPRRYRLGLGEYKFRVIAIGPSGLKSHPATYHFRVGHLTEGPPVDFCGPGQKSHPGRGSCQTRS